MQREGVFREMKQRRFYEKPSERSNRQKAEAIRRTRKLARKKLQREGLLADPKKKKVWMRAADPRAGQRPGMDRARPGHSDPARQTVVAPCGRDADAPLVARRNRQQRRNLTRRG